MHAKRIGWNLIALALFCSNALSFGFADEPTLILLQRDEFIAWSGQPLREGLVRLSEQYRVPFWLDRRVDPGRRVEASGNETRYKLLERIGSASETKQIVVPRLVVFAAPEQADRIASSVLLAREAARGSTVYRQMLTSKPFAWEALSTPREILEQAAREWKITLDSQWIPHDLWPAQSFIQTDGATILALVSASFDRMPVFKAGGIQWVALPDRLAIVQTYRQVPSPTELRAEVMKLDPRARWADQGRGAVELEATAAAHEVVWIATEAKQNAEGKNRSNAPPASGHKYSLQVRDKPVRAVIAQLAMAEQWQLQWKAQTDDHPKYLVTFTMRDVTADQLIAEACRQTGLRWERQGNVLAILDPVP